MIKVDIISGFLGAGKTTLIQKILQYCVSTKEQVVLIENEFGEIGIDGELVEREGFQVYEIVNGCICCTLKSSFLVTLTEIIEKIKPDRVIFEPSGVFIPAEIIPLLQTPELAAKCELNSLITVIDCVNYLKQSSANLYFFEKQVQHGTALALSKMQLVSPELVDQIVISLKQLNDKANIFRKVWNDMDPRDLAELLERDLQTDIHELLGNHHHVTDDHEGHHHFNDHHGFDTFGIKTVRLFTEKELTTLLNQLQNPVYGEILRGKGFLSSGEGYFEFSYVDGLFSIGKSIKPSTGRISFIGKNLNKQKLLADFTGAVG